MQDFEKLPSPPAVWVVNTPNEGVSIQLSTDQAHDGKQCLKLHYRFVGTGVNELLLTYWGGEGGKRTFDERRPTWIAETS